MRVVVRPFPVSDSEFATYVEQLLASKAKAPAIDELQERVRVVYPMAELALQHPLAVVTDQRVLYAYRDGTLAPSDPPLGEAAGPA